MRRLALITLILCLWLAGGLRFYRLGAQSLWNDEGLSLGLAGRDVPTILRSAAADIHPPGYYLLLKVWHAFTGDSEFALRAFSALAGLVLVALLYRLGRVYFDRPGALAAAALGALNPFLVYYSQEARMYALAATLGAASFLLFSLCCAPAARPPRPMAIAGWPSPTAWLPPPVSIPTTPWPSSSWPKTWRRSAASWRTAARQPAAGAPALAG